jgi:hypothetical protein
MAWKGKDWKGGISIVLLSSASKQNMVSSRQSNNRKSNSKNNSKSEKFEGNIAHFRRTVRKWEKRRR